MSSPDLMVLEWDPANTREVSTMQRIFDRHSGDRSFFTTDAEHLTKFNGTLGRMVLRTKISRWDRLNAKDAED